VPAQAITLVLVDDSSEFRRVARELFMRRGHVVLGEAACAATAHSLVDRYAPDLVVVDLCLGDESGFDLARALTRAHPGLAVVLMSSNRNLGAADRVSASGARGFIAKSELSATDLSAFLT
jgi:DNA-binding NarL/FixJ family response regulator